MKKIRESVRPKLPSQMELSNFSLDASDGADESKENKSPSMRAVSIMESAVQSITRPRMEAKIQLERERHQARYAINWCCPGYVDERCLKLSFKMILSLMVLTFCCSMLVLFPSDCDDNSAVYVSMISGILSAWLTTRFENNED